MSDTVITRRSREQGFKALRAWIINYVALRNRLRLLSSCVASSMYWCSGSWILTQSQCTHLRAIQGHRWNRSSWGGVGTYVFVKMKVKIIFDLDTHDFFLGENGKNTLGPIPNLSSSSHMHSIIEPAFRCTFGSKWSEDVTFSQQFAVFSTWDVDSSWALDDITVAAGRTFMADRAEKAMTEAGSIDARMENKNT